jgi:hypothetical protein
MKELNMSNGSEPINLIDESNRAEVTSMTPSRAFGPQRTFTSVAATIKRTADRTITAALLVACILAVAVSFAPVAAAKGQEGGVVCTGTQLPAGNCQPKALQSTPIGSIPLGCKSSSHDTVACGRRGYHVAAATAQPAGSAVSGPTQTLAAPGGRNSGVTAGGQPRAGGHTAR